MEKTPFSNDPSTPNVENRHHTTNQPPSTASEFRDSFAGKESMSSLDIAELSGKPHNDLMKAIRVMEGSWVKLGQGKFSQSSYLNSQGKKQPCFELTKTECLYIATKFNDEARAKLIFRWEQLEMERQRRPLSPLEILKHQIELMERHEKEISEVKEGLRSQNEKIQNLEAKTTTRPNYWTIAGYASHLGKSVNIKLAGVLGRKASIVSRTRGILVDECPDPRFGKVNMYSESVLADVFREHTLSAQSRKNK
jgi:phage regulator Rha-like protein